MNLSSLFKSIIFIFISLLLFLSLISYSPYDVSFLVSPPPEKIHNFIGIGGAYVGFFLFFLLGHVAYFLPFYFFFLGLDRIGIVRFYGLGKSRIVNITSLIFLILFLSAFIGLFFKEETAIFNSSGLIGFFFSNIFRKYLGVQGAFITVSLLIIINSLLVFGFFFVDSFNLIKRVSLRLANLLKRLKAKEILPKRNKPSLKATKLPKITNKKQKEVKPDIKVYVPKVFPKEESRVIEGKKREEQKAESKDYQISSKETFNPKTYKLPTPDLLKPPPSLDYREVKEDIKANIKNLEETLYDFGVEAKVVSVKRGPVVTMYELQPFPGTKIQKISALADDIALAMKTSQVRVVAPLPGRGTIGIEVPNQKKHLVYLREVLEEKKFINSPSKLTLAIGKNVSGAPVVADLKDMPHLLIAGTTGSGKTVCVNSLISSILFKAKPDEVKFILIDPKMVELASFSGIPHLLSPIISEAKKAVVALNWAVEEMERRYHLLAKEGARNIEIYNNKSQEKMSYIVIVIDELADLMVVAKDNIETTIQRLAQLSRAVGIHLILATQRPSVDVITGVIKANFSARISFKVSSKVDSRTVLDIVGAEKLLGRGDLLFLKPGAPKPIRAQGSFLDDEDTDNLTNFIRSQGAPIYEEEILKGDKKSTLKVEEDELFDEAVKVILQARQASASILQRRLRVGYTRAARLLDLMEEAGIIGPFCGSKAREILVDPESFLKEKGWL
jgi:S-DNA-T family DNA segregation ATPase FtsK/SpoIIIE